VQIDLDPGRATGTIPPPGALPPVRSRAAIRAWALRRGAALLTIAAAEAPTLRRARPSSRFADRRRRLPALVPRSPSEISADWLTEALCAPAPGARVTAVRRLESSAGTTSRARLAIDYNGPGAAVGLPRRLVVKLTDGVAQRLMLGLGGLICGEVGFYAHVRPRLEIEAPRGYFAALERRSWRTVVVIEDVLATRGARFWRPGDRLSDAQLQQLVGELAAWHGALWESPLLERWGWLRTPAAQMLLIDALLGAADRTGVGARRARVVIPAALARRDGQLREALRRSLGELGRRPHTYLHGDLHAANLYLTPEGAVGVCDWQVALRGCWAYDFAYLMATVPDSARRREGERELLDLYRVRLLAAGGGALEPEAAWEAYRRALIYPYFAWLYTLGRARAQPHFQPPEVALVLLERIARAICELDAFGALGL
jgi:hypothetical protein